MRSARPLVAAALNGAKLSLTHLGRGRSGNTFEKHHIKAVDRLLGNRWLHLERAGIYAAIARAVLHRADFARCDHPFRRDVIGSVPARFAVM